MVDSNVQQNNDQNYGYCKYCESDFVFKPDDTWFDEKGFGYSTKLVRCSYCGKIVVLKHIEDKGLDINSDIRFYK